MGILKNAIKNIGLMSAVLLCNALCAQNLKLELAEKYTDVFDYTKAAEIYEDIIIKDPSNYEALKGGVICYLKLQKSLDAERLLRILDLQDLTTKEDLLLLANAQKSNKKYDAALKTYKKYNELYPGNNLVNRYLENDNWAFKIYRDSSLFELTNSKVNSAFSDFAPCFYKNSILFSSSRTEGEIQFREYNWNSQAYVDLYKAELTSEMSIKNAELITTDINSRYHEGVTSYSATDNILYFTRNNFLNGTKRTSAEGYLNLAIYYINNFNNESEEIIPFPYNSEDYSVGHPSISKDGNTLYFTSDMPGGYGGTDLYVSVKDSGNWSKPINLGEQINTSLDEMFPHIHESGVLYFSSNGHVGLGGLDIQSIDLNADDSKVRNAGYPLNSAYDDFSIVFSEDIRNGFFASNRLGGKGDDDIYKFYISPSEFITISGKVTDLETRLPLAGTSISLIDPENPEKSELVAVSEEDGTYEFTTPYQELFVLTSSRKGYFDQEKTVASIPTSSFIDDVDFELSKYDYLAKGKVIDAEDSSLLPGARIVLYDETGAVIAEKITDFDGFYSFGLFKGHNYRITCELDGFALQSVMCDTRDRKSTTFEHDFKMFKLKVGVTVKLDNIYYDYGKAAIRADAALELDKLVTILNENPTVSIELSSHTDSRGSAAYNLNLSKKRARSAINYLISKGISKERLVSKGYGELKPLNKCIDGVKCTEKEYQLNRRTEFTILEI